MSNDCCKEFKGWCKSFTRTEAYLSALQLVLLTVFILSLTFSIVHFISCFKSKEVGKVTQTSTSYIQTNTSYIQTSTSYIQTSTSYIQTSTSTSTTTTKATDFDTSSTKHTTRQTPLPKEMQCTWTPSVKTTAVTHYYDSGLPLLTTTAAPVSLMPSDVPKSGSSELNISWTPGELFFENNTEVPYDGEYVDELKRHYLLALVKIKPPQDVTFGCILTVVAELWVLTAASCIEAIEEVDSLDSFVMIRGFSEKDEENIYLVSDILIHPLYQGVNKSYDLAALKSEESIARDQNNIVSLPTMIDYYGVTIGESLSILGYGKYRNLDKNPRSRRVRSVRVVRLPAWQCARSDAWALRHVWGGRAARRGACGQRALCAGALRARARPCHYCAGAPLLRRRVLLGVMSDNPQCGAACEPALYVNLALLRDWLDSVIYSE